MEGTGLVLVLLIAVITGGDHLRVTLAWQSVAPLIVKALCSNSEVNILYLT